MRNETGVLEKETEMKKRFKTLRSGSVWPLWASGFSVNSKQEVFVFTWALNKLNWFRSNGLQKPDRLWQEQNPQPAHGSVGSVSKQRGVWETEKNSLKLMWTVAKIR